MRVQSNLSHSEEHLRMRQISSSRVLNLQSDWFDKSLLHYSF